MLARAAAASKGDPRHSAFGAPQQHRRRDRGNVVATLRQRGQPQRKHRQPVKQIGAKPSGRDFARQIAIGARDDPHIDRLRPRRADRQHLAFLDCTEQLGLQRQRQLGDLVEQQRPAVGGAEQPVAGRGCPGKGAALVSEQCRFQHRFGERGAVDRDETRVAAWGTIVDEAGNAFLAGSGRAFDEHRDFGRGNPGSEREQRLARLGSGGRIARAVRRRGGESGDQGGGERGVGEGDVKAEAVCRSPCRCVPCRSDENMRDGRDAIARRDDRHGLPGKARQHRKGGRRRRDEQMRECRSKHGARAARAVPIAKLRRPPVVYL